MNWWQVDQTMESERLEMDVEVPSEYSMNDTKKLRQVREVNFFFLRGRVDYFAFLSVLCVLFYISPKLLYIRFFFLQWQISLIDSK